MVKPVRENLEDSVEGAPGLLAEHLGREVEYLQIQILYILCNVCVFILLCTHKTCTVPSSRYSVQIPICMSYSFVIDRKYK